MIRPVVRGLTRRAQLRLAARRARRLTPPPAGADVHVERRDGLAVVFLTVTRAGVDASDTLADAKRSGDRLAGHALVWQRQTADLWAGRPSTQNLTDRAKQIVELREGQAA